MADIFSTISAGYKAATTTPPSRTRFTNVDPKAYTGIWQGTYSNNKKFRFDISQVSGYKAQVRFTDGSSVSYQQVLIKDNAFKIGNSKFTLQKPGQAQVKTVVVNPSTGASSLSTAYATRS